MVNWLAANYGSIAIWAGALCTFGIYTILYKENKFYRFFEHIFIGVYGGYGVYITWHNIILPKWWRPMTSEGLWWWIFAAVLGSMFYFMYSKKHAWISRVIFGLFMGFAAGGIFREFYEGYFPQIGSSMKPFSGSYSNILSVAVFYVVLLAAMSYFFFSFEHKHPAVKNTAAAGRWFLMIGFGAMFGATVMGRMTLFIGRLNFLINRWIPEVRAEAQSSLFWIIMPAVVLIVSTIGYFVFRKSQKLEA
ncbi:MAG: hypothetical protein GX139_00970 [Armatimonadetes bacterium]|nr:hypothetical protein [Armatimonadota bacterium]